MVVPRLLLLLAVYVLILLYALTHVGVRDPFTFAGDEHAGSLDALPGGKSHTDSTDVRTTTTTTTTTTTKMAAASSGDAGERTHQPDDADDDCKDNAGARACKEWATNEECERNPSFMLESCTKSCGACVPATVRGGAATRLRITSDTQLGEPAVTLAKPPTDAAPINALTSMPLMGFGTAALGEYTAKAVEEAYRAGYRHFDSAQAREWYREDLVGQGLASAGAMENRAALWLTSKLHPRHHGYETTRAQVATSLRELNTDYLDLFLLHYPWCFVGLPGCPSVDDNPDVYSADAYVGSWRALEEFVLEGKIRYIGVSNVDTVQLRHIFSDAVSPRVKPSVVQGHDDPLRPNRELRKLCRSLGVHFVAYSSLGTQHAAGGKNPVLTHPELKSLAVSRGVSVPQVVLSWQMWHSHIGVIPRSTSREHMIDNRRALDLRLSEAEATVVESIAM
ncbi:hypothetical protein PPROV_000410300 [Pycnococcus provasolii]|uniref:ShKT domain-containing protein n=1 Tax=Pycnococcus provasolii TaxID=41880 RepID=A0A830HIA7_9CHLO|nr:hypothetical protein PPROV_000410300 [Pycnococcus provasolii]